MCTLQSLIIGFTSVQSICYRATNKEQLFFSSLQHNAFEWHWNTSIAEVKHCHHLEPSLCWECVLDVFVITGNVASPSMTWRGVEEKNCG